MKLQDFPLDAQLGEPCSELHEDFVNHLPCRSQTAPTGPLNLIAHFPQNVLPGPDIGKLYACPIDGVLTN